MASPTLTVLLDDGSGTFPFDISAYVLATESYDITRGRDDWQGAVTTGELSLTLNNSDGRFTPGSTILGTPSPIKVDQRIQLREGIGGGSGGWDVGGWDSGPWDTAGVTTFTRFTGYVKAWPVSWPATVGTFSTVRITATDAQARAERRTLRSMVEEGILARSPSAYYTLAETAASTTSAGDTSGNQAVPLTIAGTGTAPTFGTGVGPGVEALPAAQFFGGKYLTNGVTTSSVSASDFTILAFLDSYTGNGTIAYGKHWTLAVSGGQVTANAAGFFAGPLASPPASAGSHHLVALTLSGTTVTLYLDGVSVASGTWSTAFVIRDVLNVGADVDGLNRLTGTVSNVALFGAALSSADIAAIWGTVASADTGAARMARIAGYAGVPVGTFDASLTTVPAVAVSGQSAMEAIQAVSDAEFGLVYVDGTGALAFHNRNRVVSKTAPDLTLTSQYVTPDVTPVVDDQRLVNYMEVTAAGTGGTTVVQGATGAASETGHGRYPTSQSYLVQTDAEAVDRGKWIVANFAEPGATPRYGTLTINLFGMSDALASSVLSTLDLDCWLRVISAPSQTPGGTTVDVVVQGWSASRSAEAWTITCNVVPRSLFAPVWIFDTSRFDVDTRFYV